jgi:hypothetical protein
MPSKILDTRTVNYVPFEAETAPNAHLGGACVARMILNSDKVNPEAPAVPDATTLANQQSMYSTLRGRNAANETEWYVDPEAMRLVLNDLDTGFRGYVEYSYATREELNAKLIYTLITYDVAPAVLTGGDMDDYWVAVVGYSTDVANALIGFNLHDPSWDAGLAPFSLVSAATWNGVYLRRPVRMTSPRWGGKYVSVCDPEPEVADVGAARRLVKRPGDRIIPPDDVDGLIREGLEEYEITGRPEIRAALDRGTPSEPRLVQLLDDLDAPYYLVTFHPDGARNEVLARVAVDARYGDLMCLTAGEEPSPTQLRSRAQILRTITNRPIHVPRPVASLRADLLSELVTNVAAIGVDEARSLRLRRVVDAALVAARRPTQTVVLRPETTEVGSMLVATTSTAATLLSPSYRVTSGGLVMYVRAYASGTQTARPSDGWDEPWWPDPQPLGG